MHFCVHVFWPAEKAMKEPVGGNSKQSWLAAVAATPVAIAAMWLLWRMWQILVISAGFGPRSPMRHIGIAVALLPWQLWLVFYRSALR